MKIQWIDGVSVSPKGHQTLTLKGTVEHNGKEIMKFRTLKLQDANVRKPSCKFKAPTEQDITLWREMAKKDICMDILTKMK